MTEASRRSAVVGAEVDLVNNQGLGIPAIFQRRIAVSPSRGAVAVKVLESIAYVGRKPLRRSECLLAPWTLCQFDCGPGCEVVFPCRRKASVEDLYDEPSDGQRRWSGGFCRTRTDGSQRYQIAIPADVPWIEFRDPRRGLVVRRQPPAPAGRFLHRHPRRGAAGRARRKGVRYSVYSDASPFMEIEAAGGCPAVIRPNAEMSVAVSTRFVRTQAKAA